MDKIQGRYVLSYTDRRLLVLGDVLRVDFPPSTPSQSHRFTLQIQQDGIGGRNISGWQKPITFIGDEPDTAANSVTVYEFYTTDGGFNWVCRITTNRSQSILEGNGDGDIPVWNSELGRYIPTSAPGGSTTVYAYSFGPGEAALIKPSNCVRVRGVLVSGGASGSGGACVATGNNGVGGAAGNPGNIVKFDVDAADFPDETILFVGESGTSVIGSNTSVPVAGVNGQNTGIQDFITVLGGLASVDGNTPATVSVGSSFLGHGFITTIAGGQGGSPDSATSPTAISFPVPTGGGGGGGRWGDNNQIAGRAGGAYTNNAIGLPIVGASGGSLPGGDGVDGITTNCNVGTGGGGGAGCATAGNGGNGGNGGYPGGGGGGGGGGTNPGSGYRGGNSGAGGGGYAYIEYVCSTGE